MREDYDADDHAIGPERKRHHFVPVAYLDGWTDKAGMVSAYFADQSGTVRPSRPQAIGFERYYYSIDLPDGGRDNDSFEEMFGRVETLWPKVIAALDARTFDREALDAMYRMMGFMRVRGPAARDYNESLDLLTQRTSLKVLAEIGKLPAKLDRYRDELDTVEMTINRQRTLAKCVFRRSRPPIPTRSRPAFRSEAGHLGRLHRSFGLMV